MPFDKIEFDLTDEQLTALKPFTERISKDAKNGHGSSVIAEMFICEKDWRYRRAVVRFLDSKSVARVSVSLIDAEKDFDLRQDKARRLADLKQGLEGLAVVTIKNDLLIVEREGHKYELREIEMVQSAT